MEIRNSFLFQVVLETTAGGRLVDDWSLLNKALPWSKGGEEFWTDISTRGTSGDISIFQTPDKVLSGTGFDWLCLAELRKASDFYVGKIDYQLTAKKILLENGVSEGALTYKEKIQLLINY